MYAFGFAWVDFIYFCDLFPLLKSILFTQVYLTLPKGSCIIDTVHRLFPPSHLKSLGIWNWKLAIVFPLWCAKVAEQLNNETLLRDGRNFINYRVVC